MNAYTPEEQILIQQHESARIHASGASYETARADHLEAKAAHDRWLDGSLAQRVTSARASFLTWLGQAGVVALSFLLNCVLIQEIVPDLSPGIQRFGLSESFARALATAMLTLILFAILFSIKKSTDIKADRASLRPGLHLAVAGPIRRRISNKILIKALYLGVLAIAYTLLYRYIASGEMLDQAAATSARELENLANPTLRDSIAAKVELDQTIAGNRAASFAVYYTLEWALHCTILLVGGGRLLPQNFDLVSYSSKRDASRHREANRKFQAASARLRQICQPRTPDDGVNTLRMEYLADLQLSAESVLIPLRPLSTVAAAANGTEHAFPVAHRA